MKVAIVGAGRIGGNAGRQFASAGHEVFVSYSRDPDALRSFAEEIGAHAGRPSEAVAFADVVVFSVPWRLIDEVIPQLGSLDGKVVIDTTNQFGPSGVESFPSGETAALRNQARMPGARLVKAFNTLTSAFQAEVATRAVGERPAMFFCGDDSAAKAAAAELIAAAGFVPVDVGGLADAAILEAPRRDGAVYGEEYRPDDARRIAVALREDPAAAAALALELRVA